MLKPSQVPELVTTDNKPLLKYPISEKVYANLKILLDMKPGTWIEVDRSWCDKRKVLYSYLYPLRLRPDIRYRVFGCRNQKGKTIKIFCESPTTSLRGRLQNLSPGDSIEVKYPHDVPREKKIHMLRCKIKDLHAAGKLPVAWKYICRHTPQRSIRITCLRREE